MVKTKYMYWCVLAKQYYPVYVNINLNCTLEEEEEENVLFNDALNTFYLRL